MKSLCFSFIFFFYNLLVFAQAPLVKQWDRRFGGAEIEVLTSFQQTKDEGYILGGYSSSDSTGDKTQANRDTIGLGLFGDKTHDYWIVKTDSLGIKQWDKRFGGTEDDFLYSLQLTTDGGYILGGYSSSDSSGDKTQSHWGTPDYPDYWIVKIDSIGNKEWDKRFGGFSNDYLNSLQQTIDGGYILGGYSPSGIGGDKTQPTQGDEDYWIVKIDSIGNKEWDKRFGGTSFDRLYSLQQTGDGGYILGGTSNSNSSGDKTQNKWGTSLYQGDYWVVKIDSLGTKQWDKRFGGTGLEELRSLLQAPDGGYILGGLSGSGISGDKTQANWANSNYWIVKIDSNGNKEWEKVFGGTEGEDDFGNVTQTSYGGYLIAGTSYSDSSGNKSEDNLGVEQIWIVKTDAAGNKQWDKTIFNTGHDEVGYAIQTKDGCYAVANYTAAGIGGDKTQSSRDAGLNPTHTGDYWIIKFCDTSQPQQPAPCNLTYVNISANKTLFCSSDSSILTAHVQGAGGSSAEVLDQQQTVYNGGTSARTLAGYSEWQSFTAGITGTMTKLDIGFFTLINGVGRLSIYAGAGTGGTLLWRQNVNVVCGGGNCMLPFNVSAPVTAGQVYTFEFVPGAGMPDPYGIQIANPGPYAGGEMNIVDPSGTYPTGFDMVFKTYLNGGNALSYLWSNGENDSTTVVTADGTYYVTVTESPGCEAVDSILITEDILTAAINTNHTTCGKSNGSAVVNVSGGIAPLVLDWNNGLHTDTISNLSSGTYSVTVTDSLGCQASASGVVNSSNALSAVITGDTTPICAGGSVRICAANGFDTYIWNIGQTDSCITAVSAGNYYVTVTDANGCSAESNRLPVTVYQQPAVAISVNGDTLKSFNAVSYQWYLNGNAIPGATTPVYIVQEGGSYSVAIIDSNGCRATSNPTVISGIDDMSEDGGVRVSQLTVDSWLLTVGNNWLGGVAELFDVNGKIVFKSAIRNPQSEITADVAKGVYLLRISSNKSSVLRKVIKL